MSMFWHHAAVVTGIVFLAFNATLIMVCGVLKSRDPVLGFYGAAMTISTFLVGLGSYFLWLAASP